MKSIIVKNTNSAAQTISGILLKKGECKKIPFTQELRCHIPAYKRLGFVFRVDNSIGFAHENSEKIDNSEKIENSEYAQKEEITESPVAGNESENLKQDTVSREPEVGRGKRAYSRKKEVKDTINEDTKEDVKE